MDLSIVIPCYCASNNIRDVINSIDEVLKDIHLAYEVVLVNDSSPDNTFSVISAIAKEKDNVIAVDLAKNCGQHAALMAGFHYASGDMIATCEDDGQTAIELLPQMIDKIREGHDVACPILRDRGKRSVGRKLGTFLANKMSEWMIPRPKGGSVPIFFVAKRFIIDEIVKYNQPYPYMEGLILRSTFNIGYVEGYQKERISGSSGYNLKKLVNLWLNGFTAFSIKPLRISVCIGLLSATIGLIAGIVIIIRKLIGINILLGWSSVISIMLFMFGMVLIVLGLIGEYVGRIYICINQTPQYVVRHVEKKSEN
ncbi:MAG: glycosyltransferase family 2 protein [Pseudobutyrivibrio sp.]|nr:glycosyltransferase family 2 protein [Pseudobutyrivibrio sp.]